MKTEEAMNRRLGFSCGLTLVLAVCGARGDESIVPPEPPQYARAPTAAHAHGTRRHEGIPALAVSRGGRLWATWYAGPTPGEDKNNYVVLSTSGDGGKTWKEALTVDPDFAGPRRAFDPQVWIAPDGKLRLFWIDFTWDNWDWKAWKIKDASRPQRLWMLEIPDAESERAEHGAPVCIGTGVCICKPLVLSTGEWALPVCTWGTEKSAKLVVSADAGRTWTVRGGATLPKPHREWDEHNIVERRDGSLWLLARTKSGIDESVSTDRGVTWTEGVPSTLPHPSARFFISRLASGNLLLVKHGPLDKKIGRSHLTAYVSKDDGKTWEGGLLLDERAGISYPDGQETQDGLIRVIYDYNRTKERDILFATFREADALAGRDVSGAVCLRQIVSSGQSAVTK
jgi:hypothetical protein